MEKREASRRDAKTHNPIHPFIASKREYIPNPMNRRPELERSPAHGAIAGAVFGLFMSFRSGGHRQERARGERSLQGVAIGAARNSFIHGCQGNGGEGSRSFFRKGDVDTIIVEVLDYEEVLAVKVECDAGRRGESDAERRKEGLANGVELFPGHLVEVAGLVSYLENL